MTQSPSGAGGTHPQKDPKRAQRHSWTFQRNEPMGPGCSEEKLSKAGDNEGSRESPGIQTRPHPLSRWGPRGREEGEHTLSAASLECFIQMTQPYRGWRGGHSVTPYNMG